MPKVVIIMEYMLDIERAGADFKIQDLTNDEFDQILAILRLKRRQAYIPREDGHPNPVLSAQLLYDEGEEEEIEALKVIARRKREEDKKRKARGSAANRAFERFMKRGKK